LYLVEEAAEAAVKAQTLRAEAAEAAVLGDC
jgi:hypothetical protein